MHKFEVIEFIQGILRSGSMVTCSRAMSIQVKQCVVTEFLTAIKVTSSEIECHLKDVFGDDDVERATVNKWIIKFHDCDPRKAIIVAETCNKHLITATNNKYCKLTKDFIQNHWQITQK